MVVAAERIGVSQPTLSAWESGQKMPSVNTLEKIADVYEVSTDFLLGRTAIEKETTQKELIIPEKLYLYNGKPVWSKIYGWALVDAVHKQLILSDSHIVPFSDAQEVYALEPMFNSAALPSCVPLSKTEIKQSDEIWVEPISTDSKLRDELRGWYRIKERFVENEFGNRFYFDTYGAKWLGFENILK